MGLVNIFICKYRGVKKLICVLVNEQLTALEYVGDTYTLCINHLLICRGGSKATDVCVCR